MVAVVDVSAGARPRGHGPESRVHGRSAATAPELIGRADELARLVAAVLAPPAVAVVQGEPGIGKTRLVTELRARPECVARRFLTGAAGPVQEPFPLGPVLEAARGAGTVRSPAAPWPAELSPVAGALRPLLPELAPVLPPLPERLDDRAAARHRVFRGLRELFGSLSPVVLVLEDLHWADPQTVEFLHYLVNDPPDGMSLLITLRPDEADPRVRSLAARLPPGVGRAHLTLAPLDVPQTGDLAAAIAGADRVPAEFVEYLQDRTGGLPFAIEEVMALLRERGVLTRADGRLPREALAELAVPAAVRDHVLARTALLPVRTRVLLGAVAVLQNPAPEPLIAAVARRAPAQLAAGLRPAFRARLLVDDDGLVGFRHALAAQAVYDEIPGPDRRTLHARAAAALRAQQPGQSGRIAHHLRLAGRIAEWAVAAEQAADEAAELGNHDEAARLLEEVLRQSRPDDAAAGRLATKLGWAAREMLQPPDLDDLLREVLERDLPPPVRAELRLVRAVLLDRIIVDDRRIRELFREVLRDPGGRTDLRVFAMTVLELRNDPRTPYQQRRTWLRQVLELLPSTGDADLQLRVLGWVANQFIHLGDPDSRRVVGELLQRTGGEPRSTHAVKALETVGRAACFVGSYDLAERVLAPALDGALARENRQAEMFVRASLVLLDYFRGNWDGLADRAGAVHGHLTDVPRVRCGVELVLAGLAVAHGDLDGADRRLAGIMSTLGELDGAEAMPAAVAARARLAGARGDTAAAATIVDRFLAQRAQYVVWSDDCRGLPWLAQALVADGWSGDARDLVAEWERELRERDAPLAPAALHHARGIVAAGSGQARTAARLLLAAGDRYASARCRYDAALAREQAAAALLAAGDEPAVAAPLRAALTTYAELGAGWDLARAAHTARAHGVPVPARHRGGHRGYGNALSPREREVADLAAAGLTNKAIAEKLFLSVETVKNHLRSVLRKLDVPSRAALARRLPPPATG